MLRESEAHRFTEAHQKASLFMYVKRGSVTLWQEFISNHIKVIGEAEATLIKIKK